MNDLSIEINRIDTRKNQFFIIGHDEKDFSFTYQGKEHNSKDFKNGVPEATINNFYYAYAYNMYYIGKRKEALNVLAKVLGDKYLVDHHMNAFTFDEVAEQMEKLELALFTPSVGRYVQGECKEDYIPADDAMCVMDILQLLAENGALYIPYSKNVPSYERIGKKAEDSFDLFTMTKDEITAPIQNFNFNKEHINLSLLFEVPGTVKLNPKAADGVGLPREIETTKYRQHTIIKDGQLNVKRMEVLIPVQHRDMFSKVRFESYDHYSIYDRAVIDLSVYPIINMSYMKNSSIDDVFKATKAATILETRQKLLGYYIDKCEEALPTQKKGEFRSYTVDQIRVLEEHGLDKNLRYNGVEVTRPKNEDCDFYEIRVMTFALKGFSSIPKVDELFERIANKKKLTPALELMLEVHGMLEVKTKMNNLTLTTPNTLLLNWLTEELAKTKIDLFKIRMKIATLKMVKILTGDWFTGLKDDGKGNFIYESDGMIMNVKTDRSREYF
jgi:hypothetical protein